MADYKAVAARAARKYGLDPHVFVRQINAESGFNPNARSGAGAIGIAQIMPATAKGWGVNPLDPVAALDAAARNMARYVKSYGSYRNALVAYNAGPGRVGKPLLPETAAYIQRILGGSDPKSLSAPSSQSAVRKTRAPATQVSAPSVDQSAQRAALISQYLSTEHQAGSLTGLASGLLGLQQDASSASTPKAPKTPKANRTQADTSQGGLSTFDGKPVAAWIAPALEYARQHGWKGTVNSGYRSDAEQTRIYKSGVRPAALPQSMGGGGSNHEFKAYPGGAVDVSQAAQLAQILRRSPYANKLIWAGSKDPVHFSHPRNGSY